MSKTINIKNLLIIKSEIIARSTYEYSNHYYVKEDFFFGLFSRSVKKTDPTKYIIGIFLRGGYAVVETFDKNEHDEWVSQIDNVLNESS